MANPRINENLTKDIRAYFGSSGSGKTFNIKRDIQGDKRVLAFDPEGSFGEADGFQVTASLSEFYQLARYSMDGRYCFQGNANSFMDWSELVFALADARRPCTAVVDELTGVTTTSKAKGGWLDMLTRGRKYGLKIRAGAHSPAEIDKTLIRQVSGVWVGFQGRQADIDYLSNQLSVPSDEISRLRANPHFDCIFWKGRGRYRKP